MMAVGFGLIGTGWKGFEGFRKDPYGFFCRVNTTVSGVSKSATPDETNGATNNVWKAVRRMTKPIGSKGVLIGGAMAVALALIYVGFPLLILGTCRLHRPLCDTCRARLE